MNEKCFKYLENSMFSILSVTVSIKMKLKSWGYGIEAF